MFLVPLKQEIIFTFGDRSGVVTVASCNPSVGWTPCLLLVLKANSKGVGSGWKQHVGNQLVRLVGIPGLLSVFPFCS